ncbi:nucleotidyltransferase/DNA polymerase involved in DNA repair [Halobacteroides halobius DSM 5150]|uniref:DNA polymerase IV n=1 Tax=Halobacteroides halobius (strain ATCC 35273 / DSM 5150 / MD-1) TaxID=748449 RepID=L0KB65_HALHC|nr:DNA polymerase IV [Halobacteroides halobius]AGB41303.1 nucleotidyltransferase/DNA polymerase involved in DNA repair [Halobacteroides halobius DSM 5150]
MELDIIHIDMDAFYAAIEQRDNANLKNKPVIIGGKSKRGVVSTASYEAREYGIHSAMPIYKARQLCPHGVYLAPDHQKYKRVSAKIKNIFKKHTDLVEPLSLDEAYLDVGENKENSIKIARRIKRSVKNKLDLIASVGVSYNKYLAKLASDLNKPDGFKIISPTQVEEILYSLDVSQLWGVGPKTETKLQELGFYKIRDIATTNLQFLVSKLGKKGYQIYKLAQGEDNRKVTPPQTPKSIGKETTFKVDIKDKSKLSQYLTKLCNQVIMRAKDKEVKGKTVTLKLKYADFNEISRSKTVEEFFIKDEETLFKLATDLLAEIKLKDQVRLIGVTLSNLVTEDFKQLKLFNKLDI